MSQPRPLTARSIIASTLLGTHPPRMPVALLVKSCELFEIRENAARVALTRMVSAGELAVTDGRYELVGRLRQRQERQTQSRRGLPVDATWDGTWRMAIITGEARTAPARSEMRQTLRLARYAEWREGVWLRPANLATPLDPAALITSVEQAMIPDSRQLAEQLFTPSAWNAHARTLMTSMKPLRRQLDQGDVRALTSGFVLNATILRHLQADPLLPTQLLPKQWQGRALRESYEEFDTSFLALWGTALRR